MSIKRGNITPKKRLAGKRSRSFQKERQLLLQRWLDFAALLDFERVLPRPSEADPELMLLVLEKGAGLNRSDTINMATKPMGSLFFPFGAIFDIGEGAHDFYQFFWIVRSAFEWMVDTWENRANWPDILGSKGEDPFSSFPIPSAQRISISKWGFAYVQENPVWLYFTQAISGLELKRLRRCPVCRRIYYAWRNNKGACDTHLGLARTWRKRDKTPEYNDSRRFRKMANLKGLRGKARQDLLSLSQSLKSKGDAGE